MSDVEPPGIISSYYKNILRNPENIAMTLPQTSTLEYQSSTLRLLITTKRVLVTFLARMTLSNRRTLAQSACISSVLTVPSSCKPCIPISALPSSSFWPSCGTLVLSDHRSLTACDHTVAFLVRIMMPIGRPLSVIVSG